VIVDSGLATAVPLRAASGRRWRLRAWARLAEYSFVVPALALLFAIVLIPMLVAAYLSVHRVRLVSPRAAFMGFATTFNGLANYREILSDPVFWNALGHTLTFASFTVIGALALGLALALLLDSGVRGASVWRALMLLPWVIPPIVGGSTWAWMLETRYGVLNNLIRAVYPSADPIAWLADPSLALLAVSITNVWLRTPFMMVVLFAGLQAIPPELHEAAAVDGASAWDRFRHVTLPQLRHVILVATVLQAIWSFRDFDVIQLMTGGGPGRATEVVTTLIYRVSFETFRFGPAAAMGVLMTVFLLALTAIYIRALQARS
jgi:multiple sugar transport system permease protein